MRVRLLVGLSGPAYSLGPGDEREFPQAEAIRLIQAGYAAPVSAACIEMAVRPPAPETRHPLDHDGDGRPGGSPKPPQTADLAQLRAQYQMKFGKRPFMGWDAATLRQKLAEQE
jgi:hypothetical protein